jgi:hypothetical protein
MGRPLLQRTAPARPHLLLVHTTSLSTPPSNPAPPAPPAPPPLSPPSPPPLVIAIVVQVSRAQHRRAVWG